MTKIAKILTETYGKIGNKDKQTFADADAYFGDVVLAATNAPKAQQAKLFEVARFLETLRSKLPGNNGKFGETVESLAIGKALAKRFGKNAGAEISKLILLGGVGNNAKVWLDANAKKDKPCTSLTPTGLQAAYNRDMASMKGYDEADRLKALAISDSKRAEITKAVEGGASVADAYAGKKTGGKGNGKKKQQKLTAVQARNAIDAILEGLTPTVRKAVIATIVIEAQASEAKLKDAEEPAGKGNAKKVADNASKGKADVLPLKSTA